ncbi:MAG: MarR family transcriptional regulator [Actinobacteria bacterium]|nr:MAG: MarR family transcriptional regulator [Actinomycetota bacterium]
MGIEDADYQALLQLRTGLRRFLRWSEREAEGVGLTPVQHQLLLAVRGHPDPQGPTIGEVARYLLLRHHSAVGLVDRAESAGLVLRRQDPANHSVVRLQLTPKGAQLLEALSELHLEELSHLTPAMHALWETLERAGHRDAPKERHPAALPHGLDRAAQRETTSGASAKS